MQDHLPTVLFFSTVLFSVMSLLRVGHWRGVRYVLGATVFVLLFTFGVFFISNSFTGSGIDESVILHMKFGLEGAGFLDFWHLILIAVLLLAAAIALTIFVVRRLGPQSPQRDQAASKKHIYLYRFLGVAGLAVAAIVSPFTNNMADLVDLYSERELIAGESEFYQPVKAVEITNKRNIVYIYIEGVERTFFSTDLYPDLLPNLAKLEADNLSFTNLRQVYSTGFTIGGMVASQCGTPLFPPSDRNSMGEYDRFMENINCFGDILSDNGYRSHFIGGADTRFAGKGKFYETHGFDNVLGRDELLKSGRIGREHFNRWGAPDDELLREAANEFDTLVKGNDPFALFILTLDTHPPRGHKTPQCEGIEYGDGQDLMLNALKCADTLVPEFIKTLQSHPDFNDTLIIVSSDHLMMRNSTWRPLNKTRQRRNYLTIIDPLNQTPMSYDRPGSLLDVAPTVLSYMGASVSQMGFGRDLRNLRNLTFVETYPHGYDKVLVRMEPVLQKTLWQFPSFEKTMKVNLTETRLEFEDRWLKFPVILNLDVAGQIEDIEFDNPFRARRNGYLVKQFSPEKDFVWVDKCSHLTLFGEDNPYLTEDETYCVAFGNQSEKRIKTLPVTDGTEIRHVDIVRFINGI